MYIFMFKKQIKLGKKGRFGQMGWKMLLGSG